MDAQTLYGIFVRDGKIDKMPIWMLNSLWSTAACILVTVLFDLITAYALVFLKFKGRNGIIKFLFLWMAVPGVIGTAPGFVIFSQIRNALQMNETATYLYIYFWLIVPSGTGIFNMLLMRNFFLSIPPDIVDSAKSDGAGHRVIFRRIVCPLARSTLLLIVLFTFTGSWNNLVWPQLLLSGEDSYWQTVTVALTGYTGGSGWGQVGVSMATGVFSLIPIIIVFVITQNKMIDGIASTGLKG